MHIDKKSPIPVYYQLKNIILGKIKNGEYQEGSLIPSERDLVESLGISRMTIRQALNQLVAEGVLYREKGKGTFVSKSKIVQKNIMSFSDTVRNKGMTPSTVVLSFEKISDRLDIKNELRINENDYLYNFRRLRMADNIPIAIEEVFIPEKYCPGLEKHNLESSFYKLLKEQYSLNISFIDNVIEASKPTKEEKKLLELTDSTPVLRITNLSHNDEGTRLFYEKDVYRSDEYKYNVRIYMNRNNEL